MGLRFHMEVFGLNRSTGGKCSLQNICILNPVSTREWKYEKGKMVTAKCRTKKK